MIGLLSALLLLAILLIIVLLLAYRGADEFGQNMAKSYAKALDEIHRLEHYDRESNRHDGPPVEVFGVRPYAAPRLVPASGTRPAEQLVQGVQEAGGQPALRQEEIAQTWHDRWNSNRDWRADHSRMANNLIRRLEERAVSCPVSFSGESESDVGSSVGPVPPLRPADDLG